MVVPFYSVWVGGILNAALPCSASWPFLLLRDWAGFVGGLVLQGAGGSPLASPGNIPWASLPAERLLKVEINGLCCVEKGLRIYLYLSLSRCIVSWNAIIIFLLLVLTIPWECFFVFVFFNFFFRESVFKQSCCRTGSFTLTSLPATPKVKPFLPQAGGGGYFCSWALPLHQRGLIAGAGSL